MQRRSVLVTGGTGGLGTAVVALFRAGGWRVVVPSRSAVTDPDVAGITADLTDPGDVDAVAALAAGAAEAPLRAVVHLAGGYASGPLVHESGPGDLDAMMRLNLRPVHLVTRATLPLLLAAGGGSVVCVSSRAALAPFPGAAGYVTAKAAVLAFADAVAVEYRAAGVRCNTVLPGTIDTPANRAAQPGADTSKWVPPADVARLICFLADDASAPLTGARLPV